MDISSRGQPVEPVAMGRRLAWSGNPYAFDHVIADPSQFGDRDRTLSDLIAGAWVQFATTGNPKGANLPKWPAYTSPSYRPPEYGDAVTAQSDAQKPEVDFIRRTFETMRRMK
jgi:carboxylesterase type B